MGNSWARRTTSPAAVLELKGREAGRVLACRLCLKEEQAEQLTAPVSKGRNLGLRELEDSAGTPPTRLTLHPYCHRRGWRALWVRGHNCFYCKTCSLCQTCSLPHRQTPRSSVSLAETVCWTLGYKPGMAKQTVSRESILWTPGATSDFLIWRWMLVLPVAFLCWEISSSPGWRSSTQRLWGWSQILNPAACTSGMLGFQEC